MNTFWGDLAEISARTNQLMVIQTVARVACVCCDSGRTHGMHRLAALVFLSANFGQRYLGNRMSIAISFWSCLYPWVYDDIFYLIIIPDL